MADWTQIRAGDPSVCRYAILSPSPDPQPYVEMMRAGFLSNGIACDGLGLILDGSEFESCARHLASVGFKGAIALGGHRVEAARLAEKFFVAKNSMGVANALSFQNERVYAQNTEIQAIGSLLAEVDPGKALVLGTGAGARSVMMALFEAGWWVRLWNRSALKARPMLPLFSRFGKVELIYQPDPTECRLVVNCTPLGAKAGEAPPLEWGRVRPKTVFLDLVYRRVPTDFLRNASNRGLRAIDGREVIVESGKLALEWWCARPLSREAMREAQGLH